MSTEAFNLGHSDGKKLGYNPVNVPSSMVDESGIIKPSAEFKDQLVSAEKIINSGLEKGQTPKKLVGMNDTINIIKGLHTQLHTIHRDLVKSGVTGPDMYEADKALNGDKSQDPEHEDFLGVGEHLHATALLKATQTPLAWGHIERSAQKVHTAWMALQNLTPKAADVSITHSINSAPTLFTPGAELLHIAGAPTKFNERGAKPKRIAIDDRVLPTDKVKEGINRAKTFGTFGVRKEVIRAAENKTKGTKRVRKIQTPITVADPQKDGQLVDRLGDVDMGKTGDWSGSEGARNMPESVIPKVDKAKKGKL